MNHITLIDGFEYPIRQVAAEGIYIVNSDNSLSLLIYKDGRWIVDGSDRDHQISFVKFHPFLNLSDDELFRISDDNSLIYDDEDFWYLRIVQQFGPVTAKYKPDKKTYKEQYTFLTKYLPTVNQYSRYYIPDLALALINKELKDKNDDEYMKKLSKYKRLFEYLMNINDVDIWNDIKSPMMILMIQHDHPKLENPNILYWMLNDNDIMNDIRASQSVASYALILGKLDIVEELIQKNIYPDRYGIHEVIANKDMNVIFFLIERASRNFLTKHILTKNIIDALMIYRSPDNVKLMIYKSLYDHNLLDETHFDKIKNNALFRKLTHTLVWLKEMGRLNTEDLEEATNELIERDDVNKLKEWLNLELIDNLEYIVSKVTMRQPKILQWLADLP